MKNKLLNLFLTFFRIGLFTFGGGYAMIPLIQRETVENHKWISDDDILEVIAIAESTPGPIAINSATFIGYKVAGVWGSFFATLGVVLPSFIIILIVAQFFEKFKESKGVKGVMSGLKPAVVGLIATAVLSIGKTVFERFFIETINFADPHLWVSIGTVIVMSVLAFKKVHPIIIICLSAVVGIVAGYCL